MRFRQILVKRYLSAPDNAPAPSFQRHGARLSPELKMFISSASLVPFSTGTFGDVILGSDLPTSDTAALLTFIYA